ncbi:hypothetical protein QY96_03526 [Bacillus thermotolerans]|nr:hypothetical protein QY96_03526 [Bacillus thermotolerans]
MSGSFSRWNLVNPLFLQLYFQSFLAGDYFGCTEIVKSK